MSMLPARLKLVASLTAAFLIFFAAPAAAQEGIGLAAAAISAAAPVEQFVVRTPELPGGARRAAAGSRPGLLTPLYVSFATMQALDMHSTLRALNNGGREANPMMGSVVKSPAGMAALKATTSLGIVMLSERLWKQNRAAAVVTMVALNAVYGAVVTHNYSVAAR
jgi:hypothetical protein